MLCIFSNILCKTYVLVIRVLLCLQQPTSRHRKWTGLLSGEARRWRLLSQARLRFLELFSERYLLFLRESFSRHISSYKYSNCFARWKCFRTNSHKKRRELFHSLICVKSKICKCTTTPFQWLIFIVANHSNVWYCYLVNLEVYSNCQLKDVDSYNNLR